MPMLSDLRVKHNENFIPAKQTQQILIISNLFITVSVNFKMEVIVQIHVQI